LRAYPSNPARRLTVKYRRGERGVFTREEMKRLFPAGVEEFGPWRDLAAKTCFLLAATTGMRRNEARALRWQNVDLAGRVLRVHEAFKGQKRPGAPKWERLRETRLTNGVARHLAALRRDEEDSDPVFHHPTGQVVGTEWWETCFNEALAQGMNWGGNLAGF
jgi:integrase